MLYKTGDIIYLVKDLDFIEKMYNKIGDEWGFERFYLEREPRDIGDTSPWHIMNGNLQDIFDRPLKIIEVIDSLTNKCAGYNVTSVDDNPFIIERSLILYDFEIDGFHDLSKELVDGHQAIISMGMLELKDNLDKI